MNVLSKPTDCATGGLSTNIRTLRANLLLSTCIAVTGIAAPIALSFVLQALSDATPLQAFAAGAALCSTSLGTTFAILNASGLSRTRLGVVLSTAAMLDDIVGLIMVQVISNLGTTSAAFSPIFVIRPVFVSIAFATLVPLLVWAFSRLFIFIAEDRQSISGRMVYRTTSSSRFVFLLHTLYLLGLVTSASYAGTSNLFSAYIAGATVSWWNGEVRVFIPGTKGDSRVSKEEVREPAISDRISARHEHQRHLNSSTGLQTYDEYYRPAVDTVLKPLFFASIGFSIPISRMFTGTIVWRGLVYTSLMLFGKLLCGSWLVRLGISHEQENRINVVSQQSKNTDELEIARQQEAAAVLSSPVSPLPISLYPAAILGCAMTARGEIGFLISSLAEATGIFRANTNGGQTGEIEQASEIFLVITWAIMLCTFLGPLCTGLLVKRVKALEARKGPASRDVLGVWGVDKPTEHHEL